MRSEAVLVLALVFGLARNGASQEASIALVGGTVIDGNGGPPLPDAVVVIRQGRIAEIGVRSKTSIPQGAQVLDASGKFLTPGFIDTNVHLSLYGGHTGERYETLVRYHDRHEDVVLESAQLQ
ncbi:MAG TPA: hydrolase, partial [Vicinamibacteria bacterium]